MSPNFSDNTNMDTIDFKKLSEQLRSDFTGKWLEKGGYEQEVLQFIFLYSAGLCLCCLAVRLYLI